MKKIFWFLSVSGLLLSLSAFADGEKKLLGDHGSGSRSNFVHLIELFDEEGEKILLDDEPLLPFSTKQTCGECHSYDIISSGWHFNAADINAPAGRPGQPWILTDNAAASQIPLSYRDWPGTYSPRQIGLTNWEFALLFGRHTPGGIGEDLTEEPDFDARWTESGELRINCLSCHDAEAAHDQSEYPIQIARQNFRWAAAATCGFAGVTGAAKDMPPMYDHLMPPVLDDSSKIPPSISYNKNRIDDKGKVFFDIVAKIPNQRCYFCHSNIDVGDEKWASDEDVHLAAGLSCLDCHRNGLDHDITRGYETESANSKNPLAAVSSCRGCHLGDENSPNPQQGRLGAPEPLHAGIPTVHFDKLTCTACHSGPWPEQNTIRTKTARAHALGAKGADLSDDAPPHIIYPVFAKQYDGKIAPHKMIWAAFWGWNDGENLVPILPERVPFIKDIGSSQKVNSPKSTADKIKAVLKKLSLVQSDIMKKPVYVAGGKLYQLGDDGKLTSEEHGFAEPYLWPIAHNVRPAAQALGVRACEDCHSAKQPFFFGNVEIDSPVLSQNRLVKKMTDFQDIDVVYARAFAFSFVFRPMLKVVALGSCALLAAVLILYALKALACAVKFLAGAKPAEIIENENTEGPLAVINLAKKFIYFLTIVSFAVLAVTGFGPLIFSKALTGYILMTHATFAPVFAGSLAVLVLLTVHRNRFDKNDWPLFKGSCLIRKVCFWLIIILSLPVILSSVLSMFPIFGTQGQKCLLIIHRYCAITFAVVALIHTFLIIFAGSKKANILTER